MLLRIENEIEKKRILLYENGGIASEKTLAMTLTMFFNGTQHIVIASVCSDDFSRPGSLRAERSNLSIINKIHLLIRSKWNCEKLTKKDVFTE